MLSLKFLWEVICRGVTRAKFLGLSNPDDKTFRVTGQHERSNFAEFILFKNLNFSTNVDHGLLGHPRK